MTTRTLSEYQDISLQKLTDRLYEDFYETLDVLVRNIDDHCAFLKLKDLSEIYSSYIIFCLKLSESTKKYLGQRRLVFSVYIQELIEKDNTGHDCKHCSGRCDLQHTAKLIDFTASLEEAKTMISRMHVAVTNEFAATDHVLKVLHSKVTLLEHLMHECLFIEEKSLLPKIKEAQRNIHAVS